MKAMLTTVLFLFLQGIVFGQSTPQPPKTPNTSEVRSSNYSYNNTRSNTSISVKNSTTTYRFSARFSNRKTKEVEKIIAKELKKQQLKTTGKTKLWTLSEDGEKVMTCRLSSGRIKLFLDKEFASERLVEKIVDLGDQLKSAISGTESEE